MKIKVNKELHPIKTFRKSLLANFTNLKNSEVYSNREKIKYFVYTTQTHPNSEFH